MRSPTAREANSRLPFGRAMLPHGQYGEHMCLPFDAPAVEVTALDLVFRHPPSSFVARVFAGSKRVWSECGAGQSAQDGVQCPRTRTVALNKAHLRHWVGTWVDFTVCRVRIDWSSNANNMSNSESKFLSSPPNSKLPPKVSTDRELSAASGMCPTHKGLA